MWCLPFALRRQLRHLLRGLSSVSHRSQCSLQLKVKIPKEVKFVVCVWPIPWGNGEQQRCPTRESLTIRRYNPLKSKHQVPNRGTMGTVLTVFGLTRRAGDRAPQPPSLRTDPLTLDQLVQSSKLVVLRGPRTSSRCSVEHELLLLHHTCIWTRVASDVFCIMFKIRLLLMCGCSGTTENKTVLHTQLNVGFLDWSYLIVGRRACRGLSIAPGGVLQALLHARASAGNPPTVPKDGLELSH